MDGKCTVYTVVPSWNIHVAFKTDMIVFFTLFYRHRHHSNTELKADQPLHLKSLGKTVLSDWLKLRKSRFDRHWRYLWLRKTAVKATSGCPLKLRKILNYNLFSFVFWVTAVFFRLLSLFFWARRRFFSFSEFLSKHVHEFNFKSCNGRWKGPSV